MYPRCIIDIRQAASRLGCWMLGGCRLACLWTLICPWPLICLWPGNAGAITFDSDLPPDRVQADLALPSHGVSALQVAQAARIGEPERFRGAASPVALRMQVLPNHPDAFLAMIKWSRAAENGNGTDWRLEALLLQMQPNHEPLVSSRDLLAEGSQPADGHNDDATPVSFDFAPYAIDTATQAFGARYHTFSSGSGSATSMQHVRLYRLDGEKLLPVYEFAASEQETNCEAGDDMGSMSCRSEEHRRLLRVTKKKTDAAFEWEESDRITRRIDDETPTSEKTHKRLRWNGTRYEDVPVPPR